MAIPFHIAGEFPALTRQRGDQYWREGRVDLVATSHNRIEAIVRGTVAYTVAITRNRKGVLGFSCNCPFAADRYVCKHIWATLLEADTSVGIPGFSPASPVAKRRPEAPPPPEWTTKLRTLAARMSVASAAGAPSPTWPQGKRVVYILDFHETSYRQNGLVVELGVESLLKTGEWGAPKAFRLPEKVWQSAPDALDREVAQMLLGAQPEYGYQVVGTSAKRYIVAPTAFDTTLRKMAESGRARLRNDDDRGVTALTWDDGGRWHFELEITPEPAVQRYVLQGVFVRDEERLALHMPEILMRGGLFVHDHRLSRFVDDGQFDLLYALRTELSVVVDADQLLDLLDELHRLPRLPTLRLPTDFAITTSQGTPRPRLDLTTAGPGGTTDRIEGTLSFDYDGTRVDASDPRASLFDKATRRLVHRAREAERAAAQALLAAGFKQEQSYDYSRGVLRLASSKTFRVSSELMNQGWDVGLEGLPIRPAIDFEVEVSTGIDWFDVKGEVRFEGVSASLPELLGALRKGERLVPLSDGSFGLLPDEMLERVVLLASTGALRNGSLRYSRGQAGVLDALLAATPRVNVDAMFARVRTELRSFDGIAPRDPPVGFHGTLRPYQREGLGWLGFLRRMGFGGCLADDMGLGKTVQAIALLLERREASDGPSLVVVPNSLVFNWQQEVARFAPDLRVLAHHGGKRKREAPDFGDVDLVITTYGTLRRDAVALAAVEFDYVILDEAQAVKNAETASSKAARTLRARHRLAMTGTPIENRLTELWSLFEFLTPGLLGSSAHFARAVGRPSADAPLPPTDSDPGRALLARALRPYILRRTKEQVAPELPAKLEQTLFVDLSLADRRRYDELRDHYRASLMGRIAAAGMARSKVHVLEALLRLRQAACHPGLMKPELAGESSSKLDVLEARVSEIVAERHKVLVFSQFTSLLAIVKRAFDRAGIVYEYLDGKTRKREESVRRFQEAPDCPVFLISLKAGGLGLNLTAADYVFLLDPWWNPAVEAQAIDRTHRIGQTRRVFATRIIARDTVEEKVLQLQEQKRDLADAIIRADTGPLSTLTREDLELLLT
ncbi:MAG: DEAD/DEAH box helicase [Gemmatimonadaceae bacterium]